MDYPSSTGEKKSQPEQQDPTPSPIPVMPEGAVNVVIVKPEVGVDEVAVNVVGVNAVTVNAVIS